MFSAFYIVWHEKEIFNTYIYIFQTEIEKFKEKFIYPTIIETESKERSYPFQVLKVQHSHTHHHLEEEHMNCVNCFSS